jgi:hypothetical protein
MSDLCKVEPIAAERERGQWRLKDFGCGHQPGSKRQERHGRVYPKFARATSWSGAVAQSVGRSTIIAKQPKRIGFVAESSLPEKLLALRKGDRYFQARPILWNAQ